MRIIKIDPERRRIGLSLRKVDSPAYADLDWKMALSGEVGGTHRPVEESAQDEAPVSNETTEEPAQDEAQVPSETTEEPAQDETPVPSENTPGEPSKPLEKPAAEAPASEQEIGSDEVSNQEEPQNEESSS